MRKSTFFICAGGAIEIISTIAGVRSNASMNGLSILTWIGLTLACYGIYLMITSQDSTAGKQGRND